jgi:hypothetical protein
MGDTTAVACNNFNWYGKLYIASGDYQHIIPNTRGCDSILTLHLTVNSSTMGDTSVVACDRYEWFGNTLTTSGNYLQILTNAKGCDSIQTLHLTIKKSTRSDTSATACDSFTWYGKSYGESGDAEHVFTNAAGCDSVLTLHLTILSLDKALTAAGDSVFSNQGGVTYQWINMDEHLPIMDATKPWFIVTTSGNYAVLLDNGTCRDTSEVVYITALSIRKHNEATTLSAYPNPSTGQFNILYNGNKTATVKIKNMIGKVIYEGTLNNGGSVIDLQNQAPGMYILQVLDEHGIFEQRLSKY